MPSIFQMSASMPASWQVLDRLAHQRRTQLGVEAVGVAVDLLELVVLGGNEQLEEELAVVLVEPVGEALEPLRLALVHLGVALRVVAHQHLGEVRVELLDVVAELVAVVEVELVLTGLLDRHGEQESALLGLGRNVRRSAELLIHEHAGRAGLRTLLDRLEHALEDQALGVGDLLGVLVAGISSIPNIFF